MRARGCFKRAAAAFVTGLCLLGAGTSQGAESSAGAVLDPGFGTGGVARLPSSSPSAASGVGTADGGLLASEGLGVRALSSLGTAGEAFGGGGSLAVPAPAPGDRFEITDLTLDSHGRLLVAGDMVFPESENPSPYLENGARAFEPKVVRIVRLLPDGALDPSFGQGGVVETDLGLPPPRDIYGHRLGPHPVVEAAAVAIDPQGRIVITGSAAFGMSRPCRGHDIFAPVADSAGFVARLTEGGVPDPSFGANGLIGGHGLGGTPLGATALDDPVVGPTGAITIRAAGANICKPLRSHLGLARLTADGRLARGFGKNGAILGPYRALIGEPGGAALALAVVPRRRPEKEGFRVRLIRLTADGAPDRSFGRGGAALLNLGPGAHGALDSLALDPKGRILIGGRSGFGRGSALVLIRVAQDGRWERDFGPRGRVVTPVARVAEYGGNDMFFDSQGRLIVIRLYTGSQGGSPGLLIARYLLH